MHGAAAGKPASSRFFNLCPTANSSQRHGPHAQLTNTTIGIQWVQPEGPIDGEWGQPLTDPLPAPTLNTGAPEA